ncbi:MAG: signal peptidase II [Pseudomonadales bacterium]|jgi:signal peptidase II|nr:signal peptidase II [Pseudomonadales bacterium]
MRPVTWRASGLRWLWITALVILLDQLTKFWIEQRFLLGERLPVLPVLDITRAHNPGAAFSFLAAAGGWQRWFFTFLAGGVSIAIIIWLRRLPFVGHKMLGVGLAFIMGGALGNVIDRLEHGFVIDFVLAHWFNQAFFPAFNVADMAINVGAALVLLDAFLEHRRARAVSG